MKEVFWMKNLNTNDYLVLYNERVGVIYCPAKGRAMTCSVQNAKNIEKCLNEYFENNLSKDDEAFLENYLDKAFRKYQYLKLREMKNLLERDSLQRFEILLTTECNLNCRYCYAHGGNYGRQLQRLDKYHAVEYLNKLILNRYHEVGEVMFFGGEPTICPDTIEAVCEFFSRNVLIGNLNRTPLFTMVTNATLMDDRMASIIQKYDIHITVSIDGPKDINDELRKDRAGNGTYEKIKSGIEKLKEFGVPPRMLEATYTQFHKDKGYTHKDIQEYLKREFNIEQILVADCEPGGRDEELLLHNTNEKPSEELPYQKTRAKAKMLRCLMADDYSDIICGAGLGACALLPNGDLYPCHRFVGHSEYRMAHFDNEFCFEEYGSFVEKLSSCFHSKKESCSKCWMKYTCGVCQAALLLKEFKDLQCDGMKEHKKKLILECTE